MLDKITEMYKKIPKPSGDILIHPDTYRDLLVCEGYSQEEAQKIVDELLEAKNG